MAITREVAIKQMQQRDEANVTQAHNVGGVCYPSTGGKFCVQCGRPSGADCPQQTVERSARRTAPDQRMKADGGKSDPQLLEVDLVHALEAVTRVLDYGFEKYGARAGWRQVDMSRYNTAARRHRRDRDKGELRDVESNLLHMAHEACNILFQLETYIRDNPGVDFLTYNPPPKAHLNGSDKNEGRATG